MSVKTRLIVEAAVCDGKAGRASDLRRLAKQFVDFTFGFYKEVPPEWAKAWLDRVEVDYYGSKLPLSQVATISVPPPS